ADTPPPKATDIVATSSSAARLLARELCAIVVGRIAVDGMNMLDAALRCVFDDQRRSLDAEVRRTAVGVRSAPGEIGLPQTPPDFSHPWLGVRIVHDAGPLPY